MSFRGHGHSIRVIKIAGCVGAVGGLYFIVSLGSRLSLLEESCASNPSRLDNWDYDQGLLSITKQQDDIYNVRMPTYMKGTLDGEITLQDLSVRCGAPLVPACPQNCQCAVSDCDIWSSRPMRL